MYVRNCLHGTDAYMVRGYYSEEGIIDDAVIPVSSYDVLWQSKTTMTTGFEKAGNCSDTQHAFPNKGPFQ